MKYSQKYDPPAPLAKIKLRNTKSLKTIANVPMLLDTGSDVTLLPKSICKKIEAEISDTKFLELEGFNESTSVAFYVYIEFIFLNKLADKEETALCPFCEIDSVVGSASGFPITKEFLTKMQKYWFSN